MPPPQGGADRGNLVRAGGNANGHRNSVELAWVHGDESGVELVVAEVAVAVDEVGEELAGGAGALDLGAVAARGGMEIVVARIGREDGADADDRNARLAG